jgi:cytochrome c-type biogenesis protein CcmH/NrfG
MIDSDISSRKAWRPAQAYGMAVVCLLLGLPVGYFIRGTAQAPTPVHVAASNPSTVTVPEGHPAMDPSTTEQKMPTLDDMKRMADKQVEPLMSKLKSTPKNAKLLNQIALNYKAAHQFKKAAEYFRKALEADPKNVAIRDDYASCLYYNGDADAAIAELQKSLKYEPSHPGTLFNLGMIRLKGKGDVDGAVAAWTELLKSNPNLPQKDAVEQLISKAKEHPDLPKTESQN